MRHALVYGLEQLVEQQRRRDLRRHFDHVDRESQAKQRLVTENVLGSSRGVAEDHEPIADEPLRDHASDNRDEVEHTGKARLGAR